PVAVAVPLEYVDFALILITQPVGGPATGSQAVELDPGFPGVADTAPPEALNLAAVVRGALFRCTEDEVGLAVEEHVLATVAVLPDVLGSLPIRRVLDLLASLRHR